MSTGTSGFESFVYYAGPIVQLLYWVVMMVVAVWAVVLFKRLVDHKIARHTRPAETGAAESAPALDIDQFVE